MRMLDLHSPIKRTVEYVGLQLPLMKHERYIAMDADGELWAFRDKPVLRERGVHCPVWEPTRGQHLPRCIGVVVPQGVNYKDSLVEYQDDGEVESESSAELTTD